MPPPATAPTWRYATEAGVALAAVIPLAAYLLTLAPSITWRNGGVDSGDTATAVAVLGLPHPPGYALFVSFGHVVTRVLFWLEPAAATNVFCALLGSSAAALTFTTSLAMLRQTVAPRAWSPSADVLAALSSALAVALGALWWQQANLTTVHAMNLLFAAALCLVAQHIMTSGAHRYEIFAATLLVGLAATHHLTLLAIPLAFGLSALPAPGSVLRLRDTTWPSAIAAGTAGLALGLIPWAAIPLIAAARPPHIWGDPTTLAGFVDVVLARQYTSYLSYPTALGFVYRLAIGVWSIAREMGPIGFFAGLTGLALLWDERRRYVLFVLVLLGTTLAFFARYAARDVESYLLPVCVAAAPAAAVGLRTLGGEVAARWPTMTPVRGGVATLALTLVSALALNWAAMDLSRDREAIDYARSALAEAPPNAVVFAEGDPHTFALWYARFALGDRPDVALVGRWFLQYPWYREHIRRLYPDLRLPPGGVVAGQALAAGEVTARPVAATADTWGVPLERGRLLYVLKRAETR